MGNQQSQFGGNNSGGDGKDDNKKKEKPKYEPPPQPTTRIGRKKRKAAGPNASAKLPTIYPTARCKLRYLRMQRIHDHLLLEEEFVENQERIRKAKAAKEKGPVSNAGDSDALDRNADERSRVDDMRGSPMGVGNLEEMIDDDHAIVSSATGPEFYVSIMSFVDKDLLEPGASILLHHKSVSVVGVLTDDADPLVSVMKLDKAPTESYADIGGLESQIQEVREAVELPLLHPELYEEMGIKPPKGVILYGGPGTGKTLLAKAVANQTSATFLRIVGSELIQKYLGDGPRLVRQIFQVAAEHAPSIVFIDEIDAIGTKRYDSTSGGEREVQRTMLELLNQLDGFDDRGDVKVIMATNKIESLDPALIRPGRIDRKILFENPDQTTKKKIFTLHTSKMSLAEDVDLDEFVNQKDDLSGADIKAMCSEAGLLALRERRYYHEFLSLLWDNLGAARSIADISIYGTSLSGFTSGDDDDDDDGAVLGLQGQIRFLETRLDRYMSRYFGEEAAVEHKVIIIGHSVGAYIGLELVRRHQEKVKMGLDRGFDILGYVALWPTLTHIGQSRRGRRLGWLLKLPFFALFISMVAKVLTRVLGTALLLALFGLTGFPEQVAQVTVDFLASRNGVYQALYMAGDEMREINSDQWNEDIWGTSSQPPSKTKLKLVLWFGEDDHWVAVHHRDELIKIRGRRPDKQWLPETVVDKTGIPHSFCIHHSKPVAERTAVWITKMIDSSP
ncbi:MAG: hypothetical protein GOMPHAMPRED_007544 [Gomphillus americanus]|uniref:26S proteasome regulatory subunit 4 homolog n=1 Tax=Gomphillus americanus TaxID=1940652 RepID=A0A8H3ETP0_9LECA|nr:MAG: hypothetical protein GOMPHAMPRED_007544 [Gomphillus americanus]